jgi:hypothetical protein
VECSFYRLTFNVLLINIKYIYLYNTEAFKFAMLLRSRVLATALISLSFVQSSTSAAVTSTLSVAAATYTVAVRAISDS